LSTSAIWVLLQAEFLGLILIVIYVGAVLVLFLFSIMMLDIEQSTQKNHWTRYWPILGLVFFALGGWIWRMGWPDLIQLSRLKFVVSTQPRFDLSELAVVLYQDYALALEIVGILLLVTMVAVTLLIYRGPRQRKTQNIAPQASINAHTQIQWMD
jgi:NADH-quinone oxidoreductase subunit J